MLNTFSQADHLQRLACPLQTLILRQSRIQRWELYIFQSSRSRQQIQTLKHEPELPVANACQALLVQLRDIDPVEQIAARAWLIYASEHVPEGRLAASARTHDRYKLPRFDLKINAAQRVHLRLTQFVVLVHSFYPDDWQRCFLRRKYCALILNCGLHTHSLSAPSTATHASWSRTEAGSCGCSLRLRPGVRGSDHNLVSWIQRAFENLRYLRVGVVGNPSFNLHWFERLVCDKLPNDCRIAGSFAPRFQRNSVLIRQCLQLIAVQTRLITECGVWNRDHVAGLRNRNADVSGHSRKQLPVGIIESNYRVVGNHILYGGRVHSDLYHPSAEHVFRKCIHLEADVLADLYLTDVRLIRADVNLHLAQILRNTEQVGSL